MPRKQVADFGTDRRAVASPNVEGSGRAETTDWKMRKLLNPPLYRSREQLGHNMR
jgi:hypothetical protein